MPVQTRRASKRARDDSDVSEEERAAKRPTTPFFRPTQPSFHERARSARKATPTRTRRPLRSYSEHAPARFRDTSASDLPELMPTSEEPPRGGSSTPATPAPPTREQSTFGWIWNSAKRYITRAPPEENAPTTEPQPRRLPPPEELSLPPQFLRLETPPQDYYRFLRAPPASADDYNWQKRRKRWDFAAKAIREDNPPFKTVKESGSNKRKIAEEAKEPEQPATPPLNSFQPPYVEDDDDDQPIEVAQPVKTPEPKQPQPAPTPLKSALRTGTKSKMNVDFDESTINTKWRDYGPAGHYTGTTFLDPADMKSKSKFPKSPEDEDDDDDEFFISKNPKFHQPNTFGVDDEDIEYGELSEEEQAALDAQNLAAQTTTPKAPRPAHAELPKTFTPSEDRVAPGDTPPGHINAGGRLFKPAAGSSLERMVQQQREKANKYKPKNSSGLSRVEPARSRSSSPPRKDSTTATADAENDMPALSDGEGSDEPTSPTPPPSQPQLGDIGANILATTAGTEATPQAGELDNTIRGPDGMTDYERSHQYDSWAQNLDWPEPQTYVEAGLCSAFIDDLLRKKWTKEDERITREWWGREFKDVDGAMEEAKRNGQRLELVWGDDIDSV